MRARTMERARRVCRRVPGTLVGISGGRARAHVYRGEGERINRKREMVICVYRE